MFYFYLLAPGGDASTAKYKPPLIALAEGMKERGIKFIANVQYYYDESGEPLFLGGRFDPKQIRAFIVGLESITAAQCRTLIMQCRHAHVPVIMFDWIASNIILKPHPNYALPDLIYWCSYNPLIVAKYHHLKTLDSRLRSWPIGFTRRVVNVAANVSIPFAERKPELLWSHRVSHQIRRKVWDQWYSREDFGPRYRVVQFHDNFKPSEQDDLWWMQTGRRHNMDFYRALGSTQLVDCCGGFEMGSRLIRQYDSFKFWEALVMGSCVISLDYEHYHFAMPVMPVAGVHYIAIRPDDVPFTNAVFAKLQTMTTDELAAIADAGKRFALENYSPNACIEMFLRDIANK